MTVFKPSNHTPNLQEVDLLEDNEFSCIVNTSGEPIMAYKMTILSESGDDIIAEGHTKKEDGNYVYHQGATNLSLPVSNKRALKIPSVNYNFHDADKTFVNGKNYQWGVRTYNAKVSSTEKPNTKVCDGYLTGSTKNIIWSKISKNQSGGQNAIDQLVYDRYIEFKTWETSDNLIVGAHDEAKTRPVVSQAKPFRQRKKINWVDTEIGINKQFVKIETTEPFDFNYHDGKQYSIFKCSDEHTVTSAFADPNSNINLAMYVSIYPDVITAREALEAGDTPGNGDPRALYPARKIVGYSSDTGEIRVHDPWPKAPENDQAYRIFEYNSVTDVYKELYTSDLVWEVPAGKQYYDTFIRAAQSAKVAYYSDPECTIYAGDLSTNITCEFYHWAEFTEVESYTEEVEEEEECTCGEDDDCKEDSKTPGKCTKTVKKTVTKEQDIKVTKAVFSFVMGANTYYAKIATPEKKTTEKLVATKVNNNRGIITIGDTAYSVAYKDLIPKLNGKISKDSQGKYNPFIAQILGGNPIDSTYFKVCTSRWDKSASGVRRLFIQPNINIKPDATNPNELVFLSGTRIDILERFYHERVSAIGGQEWINKKRDITFDRLDDSQWLIELDSNYSVSDTSVELIRDESGNGQYKAYSKDGQLIEGDSLKNYMPYAPGAYNNTLVPQSDYSVFTDFSDSMPYNVFYARQEPKILLQYRNALKPLHKGYLDEDGKFYDVESESYENDGNPLLSYYDISTEKYYNYEMTDAINRTGNYVQLFTMMIDGKLENGKFYLTENNVEVAGNSNYLYRNMVGEIKYYTYSNGFVEVDNQSSAIQLEAQCFWVNINTERIKTFREVEFRALWYDDIAPINYEKPASNPQIKNYKFDLYALNTFNEYIFLKSSGTKYEINPTWAFRGLDGTPTSFYSLENPHVYRLDIKLVDEYDKLYTASSLFNIFYETEEAPVSIVVTPICDEQANKVTVSPPAYVMSSDYYDENGKYFPSVSNHDISNGEVIIPRGKTVYYTNVTDTGEALDFPASFTLLTKVKITDDFIDANARNDKGEVEIFSIAHGLDEFIYEANIGADYYKTKAPVGYPYYLTIDFARGDTPSGYLTSERDYELAEKNDGTRIGKVKIDDEHTEYFYMDLTYYTKDNVDSVRDKPNANCYLLEIKNSSESKLEGDSVTFEKQEKTDPYTGNKTTLPFMKVSFDSNNYYVFTGDIKETEKLEVLTYKVNANKKYLVTQDENGNNKFTLNRDYCHLLLYRNDEDTPLVCFDVRSNGKFSTRDGHLQNFVNLLNPGAFSGQEQNQVKYALNPTSSKYETRDILPAPHRDYYDEAGYMTGKRIVLLKAQYDANTDTTYYPGIYMTIEKDGIKEWALDTTQDFFFFEDRQQIEGVSVSGALMDAQGKTLFLEDGYEWIDSGTPEDALKFYARNKTLTIFLKVQLEKLDNGEIKTIVYSQARYEK